MRIIVIGSGVIGLATAYFLRTRGHEVTVIERQNGPGRETSFANASLLTAGMPEPWNRPGCWRVLLASLVRSDAPLQLRLSALPQLAGWGFTFLRNSSPQAFEHNTRSNLRLALYSLKIIESLRVQTRIEYSGRASGILKIFRSAAWLHNAISTARRLESDGLNFRPLSRRETVDFEPALAPIDNQLAGAIHYTADETGDAFQFCVGLARHLREIGVHLSFESTVEALEFCSDRVIAAWIRRDQRQEERAVADQYVVTAGSYSTSLLAPLGVRLPVRPAKGYSVTFDASPAGIPLNIPIADDDRHAAVVPLGNRIRVAGTAEFAGYDLSLHPERIRNLFNVAQTILPRAGLDSATARPWCGLRSMSADGVPVIGRTPITNLWVSTGHGHLGWTMAAGSGELLADLISHRTPSVDPNPYSPARFTATR